MFLDTAFEFLDLNAQNTIQVQWIPGHHGIAGNERADAEAKAACQETSTTTKTTLSHFYRTLRANFEQQWTTSWASHPKRGRYAIADALQPSMKGSHAFRTLDRKLFGLVTQARTGHGHYGAYYRDFNIPEPH
ncbi:11997_t:CDS:1, partial [Acaulospora colombiana]